MSIFASRSQILKGTISPSPESQSPLKHNFSKFTMYDITDKNTKIFSNKKKSLHKRNHSLKSNLNPQHIEISLQNEINTQRKLSSNIDLSNSKHEKQTALPFIKTKNKPFKRGSFLQLWLDEALDPQDLNRKVSQNDDQKQQNLHQESKKVQTGKLKTMKKFQLDKQYLRSQNIPLDIIERLYNSLYIYTHGVNSIFSQLLIMTSKQQNGDTKIINIFWRAFVKLLQGCTSFQTSFQKIEQRHLRSVNQLKNLIQKKEEQFEKQKNRLEQIITKLQKQIVGIHSSFSKLQTDFKVNEATLLMTDQAFNEEVQLRLKFEQKVNHVYTSYDQLKVKYQSLLHQVQQKLLNERQTGSNIFQLQQKLNIYLAKNQELIHQLQLQKLRVNDRDQQIAIKKQELDQLIIDKEMRKQKVQQEEQNIQESLNKFNMLKFKLQETNNRLSSLQEISKEQNRRIRQQDETIQNYRISSQQLHQKYNTLGKQISKYQQTKVFQLYEISQLKQQLVNATLNIQDLKDKNKNLLNQSQNNIRKISELEFDLDNKNTALQKNTLAIAQLKAVKDKHERLFYILLEQKQILQKERNGISQKYQLQQEEVVGLRMLIQAKDQSIKDILVKSDKQKQVLKRKITGFNDTITKKQTSILSLNTKLEQSEKAKQTLKYRVNLLDKQIQDFQLIVKKLKNENQFLHQNIQKQDQQKNLLNQKLAQLYSKIQKEQYQLSLTQERLTQKTSVLDLKNQQENMEILNIKKIYQEYKTLVIKTAMYIHPMHFEDLRNRLIRSEETIELMKLIVQKMKIQIEKLNQEVIQKNLKLSQKQQKISNLEEELLAKKQKIKQIINQKNVMFKNLQEKEEKIKINLDQIENLKKKQKLLKQTNQTLTSDKNQLQINSEKLKRQASIKQIQIEKNNNLIITLSNQVTTLNQQIQSRQKNNPLKEQIKSLESECIQLKKQLIQLKIQKQAITVEVQTEKPIQLERFSMPKFDHKKKFQLQEDSKIFQEKQVQTQGKLHLYQTVPQYIHGKISQIKTLKEEQQKLRTKSTKKLLKKFQLQVENQGAPTSYYNPMKKVETNDYKRALKLTYMRR